jgi:hypothetical protein
LASLNVTLSNESGDLVIQWNDSTDALPAAFIAYGSSSDVNVNITLLASEDWSNINYAASYDVLDHIYTGSNASLVMELDGTIDSINVSATQAYSTATVDISTFYASQESRLVVDGDLQVETSADFSLASLKLSGWVEYSGDLLVSSNAEGSHAHAEINGLLMQDDKAVTGNVTVQSTAYDSLASAELMYLAGSAETVTIDPVGRSSTATVQIDQTAYNGTVNIIGEGHAAVNYLVDADSATAEVIDLSVMHGKESLNDSQDLWGIADIDLTAKWNHLNQQHDSQQTQNHNKMWDKALTIEGFNVDRDSINLHLQSSDDTSNTTEKVEVEFHHSVGCNDVIPVTTTFMGVLEDTDEYKMAKIQIAQDAIEYFQAYSGDADVGYFYREINFEYDDNPAATQVRTFMFYDLDLKTPGASGVINLGNLTGLTERNVSDRYDILVNVGDVAASLDGVHVIDSFIVNGDGGSNDVMYSLDASADIMIHDISVITESDNGAASLHLMGSTDLMSSTDTSLSLRQSMIVVHADGEDSGANLDIQEAWGTISHLRVEALYGGSASAVIQGISSIDVDNPHYLDGLYVDTVEVLAHGMDSLASVDLAVDGYINQLEMTSMFAGASLDVSIDQKQYGGVVNIYDSRDIEPDCSCNDEELDMVFSNDVKLVFENQTAQEIHIDNTHFASTDVSLAVKIEINTLDQSYSKFEALDKAVEITGWTSNESISFGGAAGALNTNFQRNNNDVDIDTLFTNAQAALNGTIDYYFGVHGGDGYLFHDKDGAGITTVVQLIDVTLFDPTKIYGVTP